MPEIQARNPRAEADEILSAGRVGLVLEPAPPTVNIGPWLADSPPARPSNDARVVSPTGTGDVRWDDLVGEDDTIAASVGHLRSSRVRGQVGRV